MELTERITQHLQEKYHPEAIILHGSRARGENRENSDWDLYVFVSDKNVHGGPETFEDQQLDICILEVLFKENNVIELFGPRLRYAVILHDTKGFAERLLADAATLYKQGRQLSDADVENRKRRFMRMLSRIEGSVQNDTLFFYHAGSFFEAVVRYWFEMRNEWSEPPYTAFPIIKEKDPAFFSLLEIIASRAPNADRAAAFREVYQRLF